MGGFQVIARAPGTATITVKTEDGGKTASCTVTVKEKIIPVESISLNQTTLSLKIGEKETLQAMVSPENATNKNISWSSDKTDVATVDENGNVSANSVGTATIKATADGVTAECTIIVEEKVIPVESITLNKTEAEIFVGAEEKLTATVLPEDATNKDVTWTSSDTTIATVDSNGKVTANSVGTAIITAKAGDKSATCTITVNPIKVTNVSITPPVSTTIKSGETLDLEAKVEPTNATNKTVTWSSDNPKVADVDQKGHVVALNQEGTAKITVTTEDGGKTDECIITVTVPEVVIPVEGVTLDKPTLDLKVGESIKLSATVKPDNATIKNVKWTSNNENVATVDGEGNVKAEGPGTTAITVETVDGKKKATCTVNVTKVLVTDVTITEKDLRLARGKSHQLEAIVQPPNATDSSVSWSTNDDTVATVDSNGTVTAKFSGTAVIWAYAGAYNDFCRVEVYLGVESVSIDTPPTELAVGGTATLTATINPSDAEDKTVTWSSDKPEIISVDPSTGEITAHQEGEATITVTTEDGEKTDSCKINVKYISLNGISLNNTEAFLKVNDTLPLTVTFNPENASNKNVTWNSDKPGIATVDDKGNVKAVSNGTAIITATAEEGGKTASCTIKVIIPVESVTIVNAPLEMAEGDTITLEADVLPEYATNKTVTWSSSNSEVATIDEETGFLKALKPGTVDITVKAGNGKSQMNRITIEEALVPVESITLDKANGEILVGKTLSLNATVLPDDANKKVTWSSDNEAVATVYQNGTVTGVSAGKATITATAVGGLTAQCNITVVTETDGALTYSFSPYDKTAYVENCDNSKIGSDGIVVIPDEYAGHKITEIGYKAFENCTNLKSVTIGQNVGTIKGYAFYGCTGLTSITIPGNVEIVYGNAFEGCSGLTSVTLEAGIRQIDGYVFSDCTRLSEIKIPDTVTTIGLGAFYNCTSLSTVTIGSGVTSIEDNTFYKCPITSLTNRSTVTPKIEYIRAIYDKDENKESPTIGGIYTSIGEGAFMGTGVKTVVIPANITSIGYQAFDSCKGLAEITIPGTVKRIERGAFYNCTSLSKVTINSGVEYIEETAFSGCPITDLDNYSGLSFNVAYTSAMYKGESNPVIEDFYTIIDNNAFQGRKELQSITIPDNIKEIGGYAFEGCSNLSTVNFGPGSKLTRIGGNAFQNCTGLTSITLPNSVTTIYAAAFSSSGLTSISIPDSVFQIDSQTFMGCTALSSVSIGTGVKTIGNDAFNGCTSLTSVEIPDNVTDIYDSVFEGCSGLTSVTIGEGITSIGQSAFRGCTSVTEYVFRGNTPPELRYEALSGLGEFDIFVPNEAVAAYKKAWPEYVGQIKTR